MCRIEFKKNFFFFIESKYKVLTTFIIDKTVNTIKYLLLIIETNNPILRNHFFYLKTEGLILIYENTIIKISPILMFLLINNDKKNL